jgi:hypothetical protein
MTADNAWLLITTGAVSMVLGAGMVWAAGRAKRHSGLVRMGRRFRSCLGRAVGGLRRRVGVLLCTSLATGVIVAAQWVVLVPLRPPPVWAVLGLPAFLAGATVTRLLVAVRVAVWAFHVRRRRARLLRRGWGGGRR